MAVLGSREAGSLRMAVANPLEAHHILHSRGAGPVEVLLLVSVNNVINAMIADVSNASMQ